MLSAGDRLSQYEVVDALGAGGMGEVYRARDTRLGRDVALKVLPQGALADDTARRRFRKEAHALLRLSHPHIASLLDFDTTPDGVAFLVMELVSGAALDAKLKRGPLPEKEVVRLGSQMLRALVAAHEQGVVHRDLKPQNVRLTSDGLVKVLDFGLAHMAPVLGDGDTTDTASGIAAGTPPYMSPEQLLGQDVDARTDVYAAGVVLYEMATGRRPFGEASGPQLVAKILQEAAPAPRAVNPGVSAVFEQVILKATDKDRELRHQTARDLLVDLERLGAGTAPDLSVPAPLRTAPGRETRAGWLLRGFAAAAALGLLGVGARSLLRPGEPHISSVRTILRLPTGEGGIEVDDVNLYYVELQRPTDRLMVAPIAGGPTREIPLPWRGFLALSLCGIRPSPPALLISRQPPETPELWVVPLDGRAPTRIEGIEGRVGQALWSPQADHLAWIETAPGADRLWVGDSLGRERRRLVEVPRDAAFGSGLGLVAWHPSGERLRFTRSDAPDQQLDLAMTGRTEAAWAYPSGSHDWGRPWGDAGAPRFAPGGRDFLLPTTQGLRVYPEPQGHWLAPRREPFSLTAPTHLYRMRFTPNGRRLVGHAYRPATEVVRLDPRTHALTTLLAGSHAGVLSYSPDGARVAWVANDDGVGQLCVSRPDGSERLQLGESTAVPEAPLWWSPDGQWIAFTANISRTPAPSFRMLLASPSQGTVEALTAEDPGAQQFDACWAPDGRSLVYGTLSASEASPASELYLRRVDILTRRVTRLAGSEGLRAPRCAHDGRILAVDAVAHQAHPAWREKTIHFQYYKLGDRRGAWTPLVVELPPRNGMYGGDLSYFQWSSDGRWVYAKDNLQQRVVRFDPRTGHPESVYEIGGLGESSSWLGLDPTDAPLVHRAANVNEILVMDWDVR